MDATTTIATARGSIGDIRTSHDASGKELPVYANSDSANVEGDHETFHGLVLPTEEEKSTLRRVAGKMPASCYYLCAVEFAERASYYGCNQVYKNFIRGPLPRGGNGAGAAAPGSKIPAGALGMGSVVATAMTEAFKFLAYALPVFFGWLADTKYGRFKMICWGVGICGLAHILMIISALPPILQSGNAIGPFALSLYMLSIGAAQFKPNISPTVMDQSPHKVAHVIEVNGEKVIVDPEESINGVMLWFYLLINVGACFGIPTTYLAKIVGYWAAYLIPTILYLMLPPLLWYLSPRLIKQPPGGSDLGNVFKVLGDCFRYGGIKKFGRHGFWEAGKPSVRAAAGTTKVYEYDDQFVEDVRRTFQACGIFLFTPIFFINDGGLGAAANALTVGMQTNGVPNDLLDNLNSVSIVIVVPIMNHIIYPLLRRYGIKWGAISRMTFGFALCTIGSVGFSILQYYVYQTSPCGYNATTCPDTFLGDDPLSTVSYGLYAIPIVITAIAEIFVNVTAYGIAYSRSPKNMKGLVSSINLFMTAIAAAIGLATAPAIQDPYLIWAFAGPTIAGGVCTVVFWFTFKHLDKEEFVINTDFSDMKRDSDRESDAEAADNKVLSGSPVTTPTKVAVEKS
ncbi:major facilitator superfamily domain-containing protein [Lasiosphaeris hirsuta]|uniref:Major facilitator superfamily domain-containing protein n=1 Tax=Lasiosphaeris hirsuta TaxID=260670 RepID=A0AA40AZH9_9PEZI|nr:major facilitator superfamily domain-containing protein [Lasiosphaeris hirsuta]